MELWKEGTPDWAFKGVKPSAPFVGKDYEPGKGLLLYASAENLAGYKDIEKEEYLYDDRAWDRHRLVFEEWSKEIRKANAPFPRVHIQPVSDGGLLVASAFVCSRLGVKVDPDPVRFIESIAVANIGKFSFNAKTNKDYAGTWKYLKESVDYVKADLESLKPAIFILPFVSWGLDELRGKLNPLVQGAQLVPVYQCNPTVINLKLGPNADVVAEENLKNRYATEPWFEWIPRLKKGMNKTIWRYLLHVDRMMDKQGLPRWGNEP
ncbi:MAG: hypothetical protein Q8R92_03645 [Deltaproteobacteria bacterium]|nr:hypothetical protein [Deltaproteobacteria bacterium]